MRTIEAPFGGPINGWAAPGNQDSRSQPCLVEGDGWMEAADCRAAETNARSTCSGWDFTNRKSLIALRLS